MLKAIYIDGVLLKDSSISLIDLEATIIPIDSVDRITIDLKNNTFSMEEILYISNKLTLLLIAISKGICCIGYDTDNNLFNPKIKNIILDLSSLTYMYLNTILSHHNGNPAIIFEDKDLLIRELSTNDFDSIYRMFKSEPIDKNNYLSSYMIDDYKTEKDKFYKYISTQYDFYGYGQYIVLYKPHNVIIGQCGFYEDNLGNTALSYYIKPEYRKMGFAYKTCNILIKFITTELFTDEIYAHINDKNLPSIKLIKKLNFNKISNSSYALIIQETV